MPEKSSLAIVAAIVFFLGLFAFSKWGPAIPLSVNQITTTKSDLFTVTGEGKVFPKPDIAQIELGFTSSGPSVTQVQSQANNVLNNVSAAIKKIGVGDKDIQTTNYNLRPDYDFQSGSQTIKGYVADVNIEVKVRDFNKINQVIDAATVNGANQVGGLSFTLDDVEKARSQARKIAIEAAKKKAAEIAGQTGINLGRIINVSEVPNANPRPLPMMVGSAVKTADGTPTQIQPGSTEVSVTVTISYETK